jgi:uncharacterized damage-inducible protein DinB
MESEEVRQHLIEIVKILRRYDKWMLQGLSLEELEWKPRSGNARTIKSLFRHILNAEIYWLKHLGDNFFSYQSKDKSMQELFETFNELESYLISLISSVSPENLKIRNPIYDNDDLKAAGSLAWMILRTSLHAVHHFGQISHIRFSMDKPPDPNLKEVTWGEAMDVITKAMLN